MYAQVNLGTNSASQICDDNYVIVFGKTLADHNKALQALLERFSPVDLSQNKARCDSNRQSMPFVLVSLYKGISLYSKKVQAIHGT